MYWAWESKKPNFALDIQLEFTNVGYCLSAQQSLSRRHQAEQEILQRILRPDVYDKDVNPGGDDTGESLRRSF